MTSLVRQTHEKRTSAIATALQLDVATEELRELPGNREAKTAADWRDVHAARLPE